MGYFPDRFSMVWLEVFNWCGCGLNSMSLEVEVDFRAFSMGSFSTDLVWSGWTTLISVVAC